MDTTVFGKQPIDAETRWQSLSRRHFQMHLSENWYIFYRFNSHLFLMVQLTRSPHWCRYGFKWWLMLPTRSHSGNGSTCCSLCHDYTFADGILIISERWIKLNKHRCHGWCRLSPISCSKQFHTWIFFGCRSSLGNTSDIYTFETNTLIDAFCATRYWHLANLSTKGALIKALAVCRKVFVKHCLSGCTNMHTLFTMDVIKPRWRHQMETCFALLNLCAENSKGHRWVPLTKASDAELWCFLWSAPWINRWVNSREAGDFRRHLACCDVIVMHNEMYSSTVPFHKYKIFRLLDSICFSSTSQ